MPYAVGSTVALVALRKHGQVLEVLPGGRYRVAIGSLTMVCTEADLETVSHAKKTQRRERDIPRPSQPAALQQAAPVRDTSRYASIDLHGMTVPDVLATLPGFVDRAIRAGLSQVTIIHGVSGGRLRVAVRDCLAQIPAVSCAARDERNPGVTIAYF